MNFDRAKTLIESAERILVTAHVRPDGDAIGSMVAFKVTIEQEAQRSARSCNVQLLLLSEAARNYQFLPAEEPWVVGTQISQGQIDAGRLDEFDLVIVVDTSAVRQLPGLGEYLKERTARAANVGSRGQDAGAAVGEVLVIDHHLSGDGIGNCRLIDSGAGAAGEIIYDLCRRAGWAIGERAAGALFAAIATDTGWFRFANTSARIYEIAGELVKAGARPDEVYQQLYLSYPAERVKLVALALATLDVHCQGRLAVMQISREMLQKSGGDRTLIENIVNEPMQIGSVIATALLVEQEDGNTRVSLRSKSQVDVNAVAGEFGGGGHARASGATLKMGLGEASKKIIAAVDAAF